MTKTITGHEIQSVLKTTKKIADQAFAAFEDAVYRFESDKDVKSPEEIFADYKSLTDKIAKYKTLQDQYNIKVKIQLNGKKTSLAEALNRVHTAGTVAKMWSKASDTEKTSRFVKSSERDPTREYKVRAMSQSECQARYVEAEAYAGILRGKIAEGNQTAFEVDDDMNFTDVTTAF